MANTNQTKFYVLPWDGNNGGRYAASNAVKVYKLQSAAEKFANEQNQTKGTNLVVRPAGIVREDA